MSHKLNIPVLLSLVAIHAIAALALWPALFTLSGVTLGIGTYFALTLTGISIGYHRLLTHGAFQCPSWLRRAFMLAGCCNLQGSPLQFVATHRAHHAHTDQAGDPHSPQESFWWGHVGWVVAERRAPIDRWARELATDPLAKRLEPTYAWIGIYLLHATLITLVGAAIGGLWLAASWLVWGVAVRTVYGWHSTWAVNSVCHRWGYVRNPSPGDARNNLWLAPFTGGESFHANHHAQQKSASFSVTWWEIDVGYGLIWLLERAGLAWGVVRDK